MAILGRIIPAGICIPKVMEARTVPRQAEKRRRIIVGAVENLPQRGRRVELSLHSLKSAATSSVDWTLTKSVLFPRSQILADGFDTS
jgi:hypothetical protein